jgi:NADPH-dependent glutamate synthase beta subunit-like oxidoreductase
MAWHEASKTTPFPAVCGRVCFAPCETACNRGKKEDGAVNINAFERFIGDYGIAHGMQHKKLTEKVMDKKVAVIGAGPAGLSCAFQLARRGYPVTIFEANADPGGMLRYGIPPFKLPRNILEAEIDAIVRMGVKIKCNTVIGKDISLADLKVGFDAIFIGIGAQEGLQLGVKGEDAVNVFSAVDFLKRINSGEAVDLGDNVVVIGGGQSSLIIARIVRRLGAEVTILYRRTIAEMPATEQEVKLASEENIKVRYLIAPIGIRSEDGKAVAVQCLKTELGEPDDSSRLRPALIEGSDLEVPCTALILAIGQRLDWQDADNYLTNKGRFNTDQNWSVDQSIYAGGAAVSPGQVTTAIGHGRMAAERIAAQLEEKRFRAPDEPDIVTDILPPGSNLFVPAESNWRGDVYRLLQMRGVSHMRPDMPLQLYPDGNGRRTLTRSR